MQRPLTSSLLVAGLAAFLATPVSAQPRYTFMRIADTNGFPGGIREPVALDDDGQVAFVAARTGDVNGVFVGSGGGVTTVADTSGTFTFFGFPGINGLGQATFFANKGDHLSGYYAGLDGATTIVENRGAVCGFGGDLFSSPSGSFSAVGMNARLPPAQAIVAGDGGRVIRIADTGTLSAPRWRSARQRVRSGGFACQASRLHLMHMRGEGWRSQHDRRYIRALCDIQRLSCDQRSRRRTVRGRRQRPGWKRDQRSLPQQPRAGPHRPG